VGAGDRPRRALRVGGGGPRRLPSASRPVRLALWGGGTVLVVLGLAQVFLPKLAASKISSRVGKYGTVEHVHVSAWPAIKLLWGDADSVEVRASRLRVTPSQTAKLLAEAHGISDLDLSSLSAKEGSLALSDVSLHKNARALSAHAFVSQADVRAALPEGFGIELLRSSEGEVEVRASGGLFGVGASVNAVAQASDGKLVVHPRGLLIEALKLTLFSDPRVYIERVEAHAANGAGGVAGYRLGIGASLR
jgi:DUF2993 family protein